MQPRLPTAPEQEGVRGEARFRFPPAALRRFRRAKAASRPMLEKGRTVADAALRYHLS